MLKSADRHRKTTDPRRGTRRPGVERLESRAVPATFTVTTTADAGPGSLRQAILNANGTSGTDTINFIIPGAGLHTIAPASPLPAITDAVTIDGYSQLGSRPNSNGLGAADNAIIAIEISGANAGPNANGLQVTAANCTVRGLAIGGFSGSGLLLSGPGNARVRGCFIGTDPTGTQRRPNREGVLVLSTGNIIGGTAPGDRNLISANRNRGVLIAIGGGNVLFGDFIGTDATGTRALGNAGAGIAISSSSNNTIGGTAAGAGDLISGNQGSGIAIDDSAPAPAPTGNSIQGCLIGTDLTGARALGNFDVGVLLADASNNTIGGTDFGAGNVISANGAHGVSIQRGLPGARADGNIIQGNSIGTNTAGVPGLGNGGNGVDIDGSNNQVGGMDPAAGNTIAFNGRKGVVVEPGLINPAGTGNSILSDSIHDNASPFAIDLNDDGPTPHAGPQTPGAGANNNQSPPINLPQTLTFNPDGSANVTGSLIGSPGTSFTLQLFSNDGANLDEGQVLVDTLGVSTDSRGRATFQDSVFLPAGGVAVTATATDPAGNTSEFANFLPPGPAPDVSVRVAGVRASMAGPGTPGSMQNCTYVVSVTNNASTPAPEMTVKDAIPTGFTLLSATPSQGRFIPNGTQIVSCEFGTLAPGQTASLTVVVQGAEGSGTTKSTARAAGNLSDANPLNNIATGPICPTQAGDFDGDGRTDFAIYDQTASQFFVLKSAGGASTPQFGNPAHRNVPVSGDFDADGRVDTAIYDQSASQYFILLSGGGASTPQFGNPAHTNIPIAGDFDGDGKADFAIYDQTQSQFFILFSGGGAVTPQFGNPGHVNIPVAGDFDGDGRTDTAIYDQTASQFFILLSGGGARTPQFGNPGHVNVPVAGDFDGDGKADIGIYDQTQSQFFILLSGGGARTPQFGNPAHRNIPVAGDFDGDGKADFAIYDQTQSQYFILLSGGGARTPQFGNPAHANIPIPSSFSGTGASAAIAGASPLAMAVAPPPSPSGPAVTSRPSHWRSGAVGTAKQQIHVPPPRPLQGQATLASERT
jgi:uncharacterized repeat protein (TIGR01451 family)